MCNVALALGGNLGDVAATFSTAVKTLKENGLLDIVVSSFYSNSAVNCITNTPDFINAALIGRWYKTPKDLLVLTQKTETALGRPKTHSSNTSRTLDIDIILFGETTISTEKLIIPHPRAKERDFVLIPLNEIAPDWIFPDTEKSIRTTLRDLLKNETISRLLKK